MRSPSDPSRPRARRPEAPLPYDEPDARAERPLPAPAPRPARRRTPLETVLLASTAALLAAVAWPIAFGGSGEAPPASTPPASPTALAPPALAPEVSLVSVPPVAETIQPPAVVQGPHIQIALLLDTSSSMDGLIDQARSQLWSVVNALDTATLHGERPTLEIALYEYGNTGITPENGFIRQVTPFTAELDRVSQALFELTTSGGSEHAGQAIHRSLDELQWRPDGLRVVYVAGNEEFDQGPVPWPVAIDHARARGVVVNTLNCTQGTPDRGWAEAAARAGGRFLQIDHDAAVEHVAAPQDDRIAALGEQLNDTYVGYGQQGRWGVRNQSAQDSNAVRSGSASSVQRAITKSSRSYVNPSWDLLDALDTEATTLDKVDRGSLPEEARDLNDAKLDAWIDDKRAKRDEIKAELARLARERAAFVEARRAEQQQGPERLDTAIVRSILEQARDAGFTIEPR